MLLFLGVGRDTGRSGLPNIKMIVTHEREKLLNAIVYFALNTEHCGVTKLFKLLYFLDFEHYKQTGRSVTGLNYHAWKMGPVPEELYDELPYPEPDLAETISIVPVPTRHEKPMLRVAPKVQFDNSHFSRRELALLEQLATEYRNNTADEMIEATHIETLPWHRVYHLEGRRRGEIPYLYAVPDDDAEFVLELEREHKETIEAYDDDRDGAVRYAF